MSLSACDSLFGGEASSKLDSLDGGVCEKDREALSALLVQPQACLSTSQCPGGSFCNPDTSACDWQCYSDTDCGADSVCSCDGICATGGDATPPDVGDPTCARDTALLQDSATTERACTLDEDCPLGSHCSAATGHCSWECLATDDEVFGCADGLVCACSGKCETGPVKAPVQEVVPLWNASPKLLRFHSDAPDSQVIRVAWTAQADGIESEPERHPRVAARVEKVHSYDPTTGSVVSTPAPFELVTPEGTVGSSVEWNGAWTLDTDGEGRTTGTAEFGVVPTADFVDSDGPWAITFTSANVAPARHTIVLTGPDTAATTPAEGAYTGTVTLASQDDADRLGVDARTRVTAWASEAGSHLLLFDAARNLTPDGTLNMSLTSGTEHFVEFMDEDVGPGRLVGRVAIVVPPTFQPNGALTDGAFELTLTTNPGHSIRFEFDLVRTGDFPTPACEPPPECSSDECETETGCDEGVCFGPFGHCVPWQDLNQGFGGTFNTLSHSSSVQWRAKSSWLEPYGWDNLGVFGNAYGFDWVERLICLDSADEPFDFAPSIVFLNETGLGDETTALAYSRELNCGDGRPLRALGLGTQRDRHALGEANTVDSAALLRACLAGLSRTAPDAVGTPEANLHDWFGPDNPCVSLGHFHPALAWLLWDDPEAPEAFPTRRGQRLAQRLLALWVETHAFVARQAGQEAELRRVLGAAADLELGRDAVELEDVMDQVENSWRLLLHRDYAQTLLELPPDALRWPDYRVPRPVSYWTFDEDDMVGNRAIDVVGNAHIRTNGFSRPAGDQGIIANNAYLAVPEDGGTIRGDLTMTMWISVPGASPYDKMIWSSHANDGRFFRFGLRGNGSMYQAYADHGTGTANRVTTGYSVVPGSLAHLAVVRDVSEKTYTFYLNGNVIGSGTYGSQPPELRTTSATNSTLALRGYSDDFALWDQALTDEQVRRVAIDGRSTISNDDAAATLFRDDIEDAEADDQFHGLPVAMLEGATAYLGTVRSFVGEATLESYAACRLGVPSGVRDDAFDRLGRALRYSVAIESLADGLYERAAVARQCDPATTACASWAGAACVEGVCMIGDEVITEEVPWQAELDRARRELLGARSALTAAGRELEACRNPLGIADGSLPLYFGDVVGDNSRFFAASDYLLNTWAGPAVETAASALAEARSAWINKHHGEVQELQTEHQRERQLESLEMGYANEIVRLCGLTEVDPFTVLGRFEPGADDPLTPESCYLSGAAGCSASSPRAECWRGEMGASVLTILGAKDDVEIASATADATITRYDIKNQYCIQRQLAVAEANDVVDGHRRTMRGLRSMRDTANAVGGWLSAVGDLATGNVAGALGNMVGIVGGDYASRMEQESEDYQAYLTQFGFQQEIQSCLAEVNMMHTEIRTAHMQIRRRIIDVERAAIDLANMQDRVRQLVYEGTAALDRELERTVPSVAHHYWTDEKIERYRSEFTWAQRLTYLAMLAVEYEFQQSLGLADGILTATNPEQLRAAIRVLEQEQAGRTINGNRPEERSLILSVRDDILQLASRAGAPEGERDWLPRQRFGRAISSPEYAVYNDDGVYLGQGIPFSLVEDGALELRCAERMWRVGATIQGDLLDEGAPGVTVLVLKRNTFASQWCDGKGDGTEYQVGSVRPSAQLFHPNADPGDEIETAAYSTAMLFPWFNVPRSQFYQQEYVEGSSEELAGRGLYGEYIVLLPELGMLDHTNSNGDEHFPLANVEDVLIRFDYLSVDDLSGL